MKSLKIKVPAFDKNELTFRTHHTQPDLILDLLLRTNQFIYNEIPYCKFIRHLFDIGADPSVTTKDMQFLTNDAESILSAYGSWENEKDNIEKLLVPNKRIASEAKRKSKQLDLLKSMDTKWQAIIEVDTANKGLGSRLKNLLLRA